MSSININNINWNSNRVSFDPKTFTYTYYTDDNNYLIDKNFVDDCPGGLNEVLYNIDNQISKSNNKIISTTNTSTINYCDYKNWKLPTSTNFYNTYDTYNGYCTTHVSDLYTEEYVEIPYEDQYVEIPLEL